jgi:hypothetical protein
MSPLARAAAWVCLAVLVTTVNAPTIDYGFVYDDVANIIEREPAWEQGWGEFFGERQWGLGRHLALVSLDLDRRDPLDPRPFHFTNIILSLLATLILWKLALAIGLSFGGALAAAAVFAVHPLHTDAIVSISGRADSMAAISVMGCILLHARGYGRSPIGFIAAGLLFLLGLASKENALVLFPLLVLFDLTIRTREDPLPRAAYAAYSVAAGVWVAAVYSNVETLAPIVYLDNPLAHVSAWQRITRAADLLWSYAALTVWPSELLPDRSFAVTRPDTVAGPLGLVAWLVSILVALVVRRRAPKAAFAFLWFPAAFAVTSNVVFPIGTIMAERLAFLPSAGFCLLVGAAVTRLAAGGRFIASTTALLVFVAVFAMGLAYDDRGRVWSGDDHYHWVAAILSPNSAKAHHNLGLIQARAAEYDKAAHSFRRSLEIYPPYSRSAYYLAGVYGYLDRPRDAAVAWERYLLEEPDDLGARTQILHLYLFTLEDYDSALPHAQACAELDPDNIEYIKTLVVIEGRLRGENIEF